MFFIVHDQETYENHPDLIGFGGKTDLKGEPIKDKNGEPIPENSWVNKIKPTDACMPERIDQAKK